MSLLEEAAAGAIWQKLSRQSNISGGLPFSL